MIIRQARREDIKQISDLCIKTYIEAFSSRFTPDELEKRIKATRSVEFYNKVFDRDTILLAEKDGKLIGYVQFGEPTFDGSVAIEKDSKELQRAYVLSEYQNKGIGTTLIKTALEHPMLKNAKNIYLDVWEYNLRAQKLYKSLGFVPVGRWDEDIIMVKKNTSIDKMHNLPQDLKKAINSNSKALAVWEDITPLAKNEWVCWVTSGKKAETRRIRIKKALSKLKGGMRRPCCWAGCPHR